MMPVIHGIEYTKKQIVIYTVMMFIVTLLPYFIGMTGFAYFGSALGLNVMFGFIWLFYCVFNADICLFVVGSFSVFKL